jgi:magnesium and cobalt transporter
MIGGISVSVPGPVWLLAIGTLALLGRIAAAVIEHSFAGVSTQTSAVQAASGKRGGAALHRAITNGTWLVGTTSIRTVGQSIETAAFSLYGASIWGTVGFFGALGLHVCCSGAIETAAKRRTGRHGATIAGKIAAWTGARRGVRSVDGDEIDPGAIRIINSALALGERHVRDVMVPLVDVISIEQDATVSEAVDILLQHRLSRAPIIETERVGVVHLKDLVVAERNGDTGPARTHARECIVVPEGKPLDSMLQDMQRARSHLVVVADEYGSVSGVVSIEDCIEEILGEIEDEHDDDDITIRQDEFGRYIAAGTTSVALVNQTLGSEFTEEEDTTIGGLVFSAIGRSAEVGDTVLLGEWTITVLSIRRRRILSVSLESGNRRIPTGP